MRSYVTSAKRPTRALEGAVDGLDAHLQQTGDLGPVKGEHLTQQEDRTLARRQHLQHGQKRE